MESKQLLIIRILQILQKYSTESHRLLQRQIIDLIQRDFDIVCERKAVGRNISFLKEAGYPIHGGRNGVYIDDRQFENSELRLLVDSVLMSRHINKKHSADLIRKIATLGSSDFKLHTKHVYIVNDWNKSDNFDFFYNIEIIGESIDRERKMIFSYLKYGNDKRLHHHMRHTVSPYQMLLHNGRYYLIAQNDKWKNISFYCVDQMKDAEIIDEPLFPLRKIDGYESGINYAKLSSELPYLYFEKPIKIALRCEAFMINDLCVWFGDNFIVDKSDDNSVEVTVSAGERAIKFWVLQYCQYVEVLSPLSLRTEVLDILSKAARKHNTEN